LLLGVGVLVVAIGSACAKPPSVIVESYAPAPCGNYWNDAAISELEDLYILSDATLAGTIRDTETDTIVIIEIANLERILGKYDRHCEALDAYLGVGKNEN